MKQMKVKKLLLCAISLIILCVCYTVTINTATARVVIPKTNTVHNSDTVNIDSVKTVEYISVKDTIETSIKFTGKCTYYGNYPKGKKTASGEVFNNNLMTCAHLTLPFGTLLKVKNLKNGKEVIVKVNDRGPAKWTGNILDLSVGAAKKVDMIRSGVVPVEITVIKIQDRLVAQS